MSKLRNKRTARDSQIAESHTHNETSSNPRKFHIEFLNTSQSMAYAAFQQHDVLFMIGPAGSAKTHLSMAFAINEILQKNKKKIIITRPVVEAGESLGYLPGTLEEKINPYLSPLIGCLERLVGENTPQREIINRSIVIAPIAYMRGNTYDDSICILDEAQNATRTQLKLFLTRMGKNSKVIVNGDVKQSDLNESSLAHVVDRLQTVPGIGVMKFKNDSIVRNPIVSAILDALDE
jgi:phosphate starvation-inducible PhoH-like protein